MATSSRWQKILATILITIMSITVFVWSPNLCSDVLAAPSTQPANLKWTGTVASWDAVPGADTYTFILKCTDASYEKYVWNYQQTQIDVSDILKEGTHTYYFIVVAKINGDYGEQADSATTTLTYTLPNLKNIKITGDTVSWDPFTGAAKYDVSIGTAGGHITANSINLNDYCGSYGFSAGTYTFEVYAEDSNGKQISAAWTYEYTYTPPKPQLATPTNLKWTGATASWNAVSNAQKYNVYLIKDGNSTNNYLINYTGTSYDMSAWLSEGTHKYTFMVSAIADGYPSSEFAESAVLQTYVVSFNSNGYGSAPDAQTVISGYKATKPSMTSDATNTFKGWYTESACTNEFDFNTPITSGITLYAKWVPTKYTFTMDAGDGSGAAIETVYDPATTITLPEYPTEWTAPNGKHFYMWKVANVGSSSSEMRLPGYSYTVNANATCTALYAVWLKGWTDTGDNGVDMSKGISSLEGTISQTGAQVTLVNPYDGISIYLKDGYTIVDNKVELVGATSNSVLATLTANYDSTEKKYYCGLVTSAINEDVIIRFKTKNDKPFYTVSFNANGYGTAPASQSVQGDTKATKPADPSASGYTFGGWYTDSACTKAYSFDNVVTGNITLYAKWTAVSSSGSGTSSTPAPAPTAATTETPKLTSGIAHVQDIGDVSVVADADGVLTIGTTGMGKRLEQITINFENNTGLSGTLQYRVHVQNIGWMDWTDAGQKCGTEGQSLRIEAIEIRLTGELADYYSVEYCVHIQDYGDMQGWVKDGALAGTTGESKRIEELKIRIVPKNSGSSMSVKYRVHVQDYGWEKSYATNGAMSGTSGESKRLEGIELFLSGTQYSGGIKYKTHVQDYGWQGWSYDGEMSGTQGESKRLEGICIELYGEIANYYDIYYRVHAQDIGWMGWAKNGECAGTAGRSARLEGIQIVLVPKGSPAPGATYEGITAVTETPFVEGF